MSTTGAGEPKSNSHTPSTDALTAFHALVLSATPAALFSVWTVAPQGLGMSCTSTSADGLAPLMAVAAACRVGEAHRPQSLSVLRAVTRTTMWLSDAS